MKVTLIARTTDSGTCSFHPEAVKMDSIVFSGKAAGICYMPDDYLDNGIQNEEAAKKRAIRNTESGHYSVFEHSHLSFLVETSKMMAIVLNSTGLYATSEKSGRYTSMNPETEIEKQLYNKWTEKFKTIIKDKTGDEYTDREIEKLALENARYLLSVFTPTTMMFTVPFGRYVLLCGWLDELADKIDYYLKDRRTVYEFSSKIYKVYYPRLRDECRELADHFRKALNLDKEKPIMVDHKDNGIKFFNFLDYYVPVNKDRMYANNLPINLHMYRDEHHVNNDSVVDDMYTLYDDYSFACLAQNQRHRTLNYSISRIEFFQFYCPKILHKDEELVKEWKEDLNELVLNDVICQATLCTVREQGNVSNFILKAKERVCARAQMEIMDVTVEQIKKFNNMSKFGLFTINPLNLLAIRDMFKKDNVDFRCAWKDYKCKEPCKHKKSDTSQRII